MIQREKFAVREDGAVLWRTYSDQSLMIQKNGTGERYVEAVDVENSGYTYTETDIPIEEATDELTIDDTLAMLKELGVDIDD